MQSKGRFLNLLRRISILNRFFCDHYPTLAVKEHAFPDEEMSLDCQPAGRIITQLAAGLYDTMARDEKRKGIFRQCCSHCPSCAKRTKRCGRWFALSATGQPAVHLPHW